MPHGNIFLAKQTKGSKVWVSIISALKELEDGLAFSFWFAPWASKEPLCGKVPLVHIYDSILKVKDVWNGMDWDLHKLYSTLPQSAADVVVKSMLVLNLPDFWICGALCFRHLFRLWG